MRIRSRKYNPIWDNELHKIFDSDIDNDIDNDIEEKKTAPPVVTSRHQWPPVVTDIDIDNDNDIDKAGKLGGRPRKAKKPIAYFEKQKKQKPLIDIDIDIDNDIEEKKTAPPAVASGAATAKRSFKSWTEQDLIDSIDDCIAEQPELAPHKDAFANYWGEKMPYGKPRLCGEKSWETPRRMATWKSRSDEYGSSGRTGRPPAGQPDGIENLFEQAKKTTR